MINEFFFFFWTNNEYVNKQNFVLLLRVRWKWLLMCVSIADRNDIDTIQWYIYNRTHPFENIIFVTAKNATSESKMNILNSPIIILVKI